MDKIKKQECSKEQIKELATMLEEANGILGCLGDLEPEGFDIEEEHHEEFGEICRSWQDGEEGYGEWCKSNKDHECPEDVPLNMLYNLQDSGWHTSGPAYKHSREIVSNGYSAYETVIKLYQDELRELVGWFPDEFFVIQDELECV